jgi:hypothetical protein
VNLKGAKPEFLSEGGKQKVVGADCVAVKLQFLERRLAFMGRIRC